MDRQIERRINSKDARDRGKTGEGQQPTGVFKRIAAQKKSGAKPRIRHTVDPRY